MTDERHEQEEPEDLEGAPEGAAPDGADSGPLDRGDSFNPPTEELFAFADRASYVEIVAWRAQIRCTLRASTDVSMPVAADDADAARTRTAYFSGTGLVQTAVHRFEALAEDETVDGPAVVESPVTTVVVPPGATIRRLASGSLLLDPGVAASARPAALGAKERA